MKLIGSLIFLLTFTACSDAIKSELISVEKPIEIQYAKGFSIQKTGNDFRLEINNPADTSKVQFSYKFSKEQKEGYIQIPLKKIISLSTTHLGMIDLLDELQSVKGVSEGKYICNPALLSKINNNECKEVFGLDQANFEDYLLIQPDAIIYSGFDNTVPILAKLTAANLTPIANYEWRETHPLGRAEWIKFFGLLYDKQELADSLFNREVEAYNTLRSEVNQSSSRSVILGSIYADVWYAPAGESYTAQLIADAGGDYVYKETKGTGSISLSSEEVFSENQETKIWIDPPAKTLRELAQMHKTYSLIGPTKSGKVFSYAENSNCYWENAAAQPHLVLEDFIKIFTQQTDTTFNFYQQLK